MLHLLAAGLSWGPVWDVLSKPDNLPIVIMLGTVAFFTYWSFSMALKNDKLKRETGDPKRDIFYPPEEDHFPKRIHVWPWLLRAEFGLHRAHLFLRAFRTEIVLSKEQRVEQLLALALPFTFLFLRLRCRQKLDIV